MKLAFLDDHLSLGGSTTFLCNLLPALKAMGMESYVIASDKDAVMQQDLEQAGIPVRFYPFGNAWRLYDNRLINAYKQLALLRPNVVIASHESVSFDLLRYVPRGVTRIGAIHVDDDWSYSLIDYYAPYLDAVACVSSTIYKKASAVVAGRGIQVVDMPYGVPVPPIEPSIKITPDEELRLLYIGRLVEPQKRVRRFIGIWEELLKLNIPITWTLVGDGAELSYLKAHMPSDGQRRVVFTGKIHYNDIQKHLVGHHVFMLMSDYEGLPLSLLEAMAHGLVPVVTEQPSGINQLINASCGFLVPPDAPVAVARILASLAGDSDRFNQLRTAAHLKVKDCFSQERMAERWAIMIRNHDPAGVEWPSAARFKGPPNGSWMPAAWYASPWLRSLRRLGHIGVCLITLRNR